MNPTTDPENTPGTGRGGPRRWLYPVVLAVAVATAVGGLAWTAFPGADTRLAAAAPAPTTPAAASTATPTAPAAKNSATAKPAPATPAPGTPGVPLDNTHAKASLHGFLGAVATVDNVSDVKKQLSPVATGAILEELGNEHLELDSNGWTQHGQSVVDSVKVLHTTATTATVQACIDSSAVTILDNKGNPIGTPDTNRRALNIYTLTQGTDGTWQVTDRTFPDNPTC
ncbi:hypothetical protein [Cryobacterium tepidiphilum]|uniref:Uncharacterized protein n=1 Tax=Cryobacterium tepidiphilum TaxID=2486026 RepID=A0A3M8LPR9_9MICO|nr:hypothetical protein [Cryobacterium tepidiphilum]RNE67371.1 hypothetical protein EEJ31_00940 [Cryobacterium tepidiphilum]